jgi:hypothetical protein
VVMRYDDTTLRLDTHGLNFGVWNFGKRLKGEDLEIRLRDKHA